MGSGSFTRLRRRRLFLLRSEGTSRPPPPPPPEPGGGERHHRRRAAVSLLYPAGSLPPISLRRTGDPDTSNYTAHTSKQTADINKEN
ncbi:hypothetical protein GUJ93_ZPchr0005g15393 [Zizania palustris]|uniref:Uncharacterized protein n=1 Tax=Zizania palustris TaxID=103762 RepID=A0A8J5W084_ZIZPA|nr:hypothetical protein GUJ93_ZPchr0005g15393 [Zizania palustris]